MRNIAFVVSVLVGACGGAEAARDAGMDAATRDGGSLGDAGVDGGATDGGERAPDAAPDAGRDGGSAADDADIDCSVIGCGPPSVCGECDAPCGCCACSEGEEVMVDGDPYVCSGGCYAMRGTAGSGAACGSTADCSVGLSCCYPCGIPGCDFVCEPTCAPGSPGCAGGCLARP